MTDLPFTLFERRNVGTQGAILFRRNREHEKRVISTLRFREHPAWSSFDSSYRVEA